MRIAVLDDYQSAASRMADWAKVGADSDVTFFSRHLATVDDAAEVLAPFEVLVCMRERMPIPRALIERLPRLRYIVFTGSHSTVIDFAAAAERDILVSRTDAKPSPSAAELTWALVLACARHVPQEHQAMREGGWQTSVGMLLRGKTLGILGLGTLGAIVAGYGRAFGMDVIAWSRNLTDERAAAAGATRLDLDDLLRRADVVSLHLKLGPRSAGLVGAREIALMKPGAILINTSRGPLIDEAAMIDALRAGRIRVGLDVFDREPMPPDHPLRTCPNTVLTPHIGFVTEDSYRGFYGGAVAAIAAWRAGAPINLVDGTTRSQ